jgi:hypothetical protein
MMKVNILYALNQNYTTIQAHALLLCNKCSAWNSDSSPSNVTNYIMVYFTDH